MFHTYRSPTNILFSKWASQDYRHRLWPCFKHSQTCAREAQISCKSYSLSTGMAGNCLEPVGAPEGWHALNYSRSTVIVTANLPIGLPPDTTLHAPSRYLSCAYNDTLKYDDTYNIHIHIHFFVCYTVAKAAESGTNIGSDLPSCLIHHYHNETPSQRIREGSP